MTHHWRIWASPMVLSHLTTQMFLGPWILVGESGRKSPLLKLARLGRALHQTHFSFWAAGSLKAATCFFAIPGLGGCSGTSTLMVEGPKFLPLAWQLFSLFEVCLDPVSGVVWVRDQQMLSSIPTLGSPGIPGTVTLGVGGHGWTWECQTAWLVPPVLGFWVTQGEMW